MLFNPTKLSKLFLKVADHSHTAKLTVSSLPSSYLTSQQHLSDLITPSSLKFYFYLAPRKSHSWFSFYFEFFSCPYHHSFPADLIQPQGFKFVLILTAPKLSLNWTQELALQHLYLDALNSTYPKQNTWHSSTPMPSSTVFLNSVNGNSNLAGTKFILDSPICLKILSVLSSKHVQNLMSSHYLHW